MPDYGITTGLPQLPAGLPDKEAQLVQPLYQAINSLAQAISISSGNVEYSQVELGQRNQLANVLTQNHRRVYAKAVSPLSYGKIVHLYLDSGKIAAEYADATNNTKPAHGIVNAPLGIPAGEFGEILLIEGFTGGIGGTVFGQYYYLGTNGDVQVARPAAAGSIIQACGFGLGSLGFYLHISSLYGQN